MIMTRFRGFLPLLCGVVGLVLCAGSAPAAVVSPAVAENGSVIVTTETAEVREGPATGYDVITVVANGEIFVKEGRTGAWYYIRINDDTFGWISGRAVSRYQTDEDEAPSTYVEPRDEPIDREYYPSYPYDSPYWGGFYDYPFYYWGQPYFYSDYYYYGNDHYRGRSWEHGSGYPRTWNNRQYRDNGWQGGDDSHRNFNGGPRVAPVPRPPGPSFRPHSPALRPSMPRGQPGFRRR